MHMIIPLFSTPAAFERTDTLSNQRIDGCVFESDDELVSSVSMRCEIEEVYIVNKGRDTNNRRGDTNNRRGDTNRDTNRNNNNRRDISSTDTDISNNTALLYKHSCDIPLSSLFIDSPSLVASLLLGINTLPTDTHKSTHKSKQIFSSGEITRHLLKYMRYEEIPEHYTKRGNNYRRREISGNIPLSSGNLHSLVNIRKYITHKNRIRIDMGVLCSSLQIVAPSEFYIVIEKKNEKPQHNTRR